MSKTTKNDEVDNAVNSDETALVSTDAMDFLFGALTEEEAPAAKRFTIPALHVYKSGKKYADKGASSGFVVDYLDNTRIEVNIPSIRLYLLDATPIMQRVMWPYDVATGKRLQGKDAPKDPWCGSSNGVTPRDGDLFNYIGKTYVDWRTQQPTTIVKDGCSTCPLGQWVGLVDDDGKAVMVDNGKGVLQHRQEMPPCQEVPAFVLYDFDRKTLLLYRAVNFTQRVHIMGTRRSRRWGAIKGLGEYFATNGGTSLPEVMPDRNTILPVITTIKTVQNDFGFEPVMSFELAKDGITPQEINELATMKQFYRDNKVRELISGDFYAESMFNEDVAVSNNVVADSPF